MLAVLHRVDGCHSCGRWPAGVAGDSMTAAVLSALPDMWWGIKLGVPLGCVIYWLLRYMERSWGLL
jgi:hypothetical protein